MMNCFCGMVDRPIPFSLISSWDHGQRSSPSRISDTWRAGFEPEQNLGSGFDNHYTMCQHGFEPVLEKNLFFENCYIQPSLVIMQFERSVPHNMLMFFFLLYGFFEKVSLGKNFHFCLNLARKIKMSVGQNEEFL